MTNYIGKKVIVRGIQSGVYFGELVYQNGQEVELKNCRNIWEWHGANNLSDIADKGIAQLDKSKISVPVKSVVFTDICQIIPMSKVAVKCLEGAKEWTV